MLHKSDTCPASHNSAIIGCIMRQLTVYVEFVHSLFLLSFFSKTADVIRFLCIG
ncbi:MAG: hypothetical protein J6Y71_00170 [Ruminococcus sp.]|nr:hypothetical protein [Ruminococcus sp.]